MKKVFSIFAGMAIAILAVSCVSTADPAPVPEAEDASNPTFEKAYQKYQSKLILDGAKSYTVRSGDTLSVITQKHYGAGSTYYFPVIMLASRGVVADPNLIRPGMKLTIPDLQKNLGDPAARENMKAFIGEIAAVYGHKGNAAVQNRLLDLAKSL
ncbi:MAG: LysM peptidoglycan-binding domain-containing protein [Spirochaetales bacterium]|jgi:LysM repeat protein|nr:LysM peptidoglycan-binding domain-containing protein [Spirochaetales bacterium]